MDACAPVCPSQRGLCFVTASCPACTLPPSAMASVLSNMRPTFLAHLDRPTRGALALPLSGTRQTYCMLWHACCSPCSTAQPRNDTCSHLLVLMRSTKACNS